MDKEYQYQNLSVYLHFYISMCVLLLFAVFKCICACFVLLNFLVYYCLDDMIMDGYAWGFIILIISFIFLSLFSFAFVLCILSLSLSLSYFTLMVTWWSIISTHVSCYWWHCWDVNAGTLGWDQHHVENLSLYAFCAMTTVAERWWSLDVTCQYFDVIV